MTKNATGKWVARFGKLIELTVHTDKRSNEFISFKLECKDGEFNFYGVCFNSNVVASMKAALGEHVWLLGSLLKRETDGKTLTSFKAHVFHSQKPIATKNMAA